MQSSEEWAPSVSDFGELVGRVSQLEDTVERQTDSIKVLVHGHELLVTQMAELAVSQRKADEHRWRMDAALQENNRMTAETLQATSTIRDLLAAGRVSARFASVVKKMILWGSPVVSAAAAAWWAIKGK